MATFQRFSEDSVDIFVQFSFHNFVAMQVYFSGACIPTVSRWLGVGDWLGL